MAQDDFLTFVERVKQAESRGQRFGKDGKLLTSSAGAQGEMQVMPATQRRPGFGITPVRDNSPDEIARVGRDLLKALDGYYGGNKMYAAAAYNWGKSNVDKWIANGADFNKLPKETQGYLKRIQPETLPSMAKKAPADTPEVGPAVMEPPLGISASAAPAAVAAAPIARAEDLGSGYKAALALSFLGSEDKDRPTTDSELEDRLNETALAEFNKELEDYTPKNALADVELTALNPAKFMQPVKMASGGMPFVPSVGIRPSAKKQLDEIKARFDKYNADAEAYNAAADAYNAGPQTEEFTMVAPRHPSEPVPVNPFDKMKGAAPPPAPVTIEQYEKMAADAKRDAINRRTALAVVSDPERYGLSINKFFADGGEAKADSDAVEMLRRFDAQGVAGSGDGKTMAGGKFGYTHPLDDETKLKLELMGHYVKVPGFKHSGVDAGNVVYEKQLDKDSSIRAMLGAARGQGINRGSLTYSRRFADGGEAKSQPSEAKEMLRRFDGGEAKGLSVLEMGDMSSPAYRAYLERKQALGGSYPETFFAPMVKNGVWAVRNFLSGLGKPKSGQLPPWHYEFENAKREAAIRQLTKEEIAEIYRTGTTARLPELLENASVIGSRVGRIPMPKPASSHNLLKRLEDEVLAPAVRRSAADQGVIIANQMKDIYDQKGFDPAQYTGQFGGLEPVNRSNGSPETGEVALTPEEIAAASRPATFNPNIARQGAAARALAAQRDVNTLPDPRTYAAVSGFLGQAPDELGFSAMHPDIKGITTAGEAGFAASLVPAVAPVVAPIARAVGKGATALGMKAEKALEGPVTRTLEGGGRSAEMLKALGAQPSYAVRPKGGHFELRTEYNAKGDRVTDDVTKTVGTYLADTPDQPLNNWFNTKYATYLRRDLGAEGDPFVKAADAGKKLHIPNEPLSEDWQRTLNFVRKSEGMPPQGFATTEYGRRVEGALDASLNIRELGELAGNQYFLDRIPPGITRFINTNPEMRIYSLDDIMESGPRAESLRDTMLEMRQPSVSFYGEPIDIPKNYRLTNESLQGLTPVQASEKAALFTEWKDTARQKAATLSVRKNKDISKQNVGDGYLWINPPDLSVDPKIRQIVQDVGCDGGWCTQQERFAMNYGSGNSRLSILIDNKNRPVAQMTIEDLGPPNPKDFIKSLSPQEIAAFRSNPLYRHIQDDELHLFADSFPQYDQYVRNAPPRLSITEIKARGNKADVVNTVSSTDLKKIQDQVKDLDARFDLQYVQNLKGIGMTDLTSHVRDTILGLDVTLSKATATAILKEAARLNGGSSYIKKDPQEINRIIMQAYWNIKQPPINRAKGGMVERQSNDNRAYL